MANNLVAMNIKRKDAEIASHGFSVFLDPKRIKLQDAEIPEMMEEEEPVAEANVPPTMSMPSLVLPTQQGQEALHDCTVSTTSGTKCSEPPFGADQVAPMDVEADVRQFQVPEQPQPWQQAPFFSGFF